MLDIKSNLTETPTRKRKREAYSSKSCAVAVPAKNEAACFTNAAFSSTPKKIIARRRINVPPLAKENTNPFLSLKSCLEEKSIADIVNKKVLTDVKVPAVNPFEVQRKPPKKKKREDACFENPALNLDLPEKQFNPFEVVRQEVQTPTKCFVNEALNIRGNDVPATLNPYEIQRNQEPMKTPAKLRAGVENLAMNDELMPTRLQIGIPFTPTIGCRIDFRGLPLSQLTPSKLLAEKLIFSPVLLPPKRSLDVISEEPTLDIGKELDLYQLELENSINEAKLRKYELQVAADEEVVTADNAEIIENVQLIEKPTEETKHVVKEEESVIVKEVNVSVAEKKNADVVHASESEDEEEGGFKAPTVFVRSYRPAATMTSTENRLKASSKESLNSIKSNKSDKSEELNQKINAASSMHNMKNILRKSIRKIMQQGKHQQQQQQEQQQAEDKLDLETEKVKNNVINNLRYSLRRRPQKTAVNVKKQEEVTATAEISIIDSSERVFKLKSSVPQMEYIKIEQLTNEKKHTLRNSIRRSTREVMRHVFHRSHEAYTTYK